MSISTQTTATASPITGNCVLVHPEMGIYLGSAMGLGFWSKLDPAGQDAAVVFESAQLGREIAQTWDDGLPDNSYFVQITPDSNLDGGRYASIQACVQAGLPAWNPNGDSERWLSGKGSVHCIYVDARDSVVADLSVKARLDLHTGHLVLDQGGGWFRGQCPSAPATHSEFDALREADPVLGALPNRVEYVDERGRCLLAQVSDDGVNVERNTFDQALNLGFAFAPFNASFVRAYGAITNIDPKEKPMGILNQIFIEGAPAYRSAVLWQVAKWNAMRFWMIEAVHKHLLAGSRGVMYRPDATEVPTQMVDWSPMCLTPDSNGGAILTSYRPDPEIGGMSICETVKFPDAALACEAFVDRAQYMPNFVSDVDQTVVPGVAPNLLLSVLQPERSQCAQAAGQVPSM